MYVNYSNDWSYLISVAVIQALEMWELGLHIKNNFFWLHGIVTVSCGLFLDVVKGLVVEHGV